MHCITPTLNKVKLNSCILGVSLPTLKARCINVNIIQQ